MKTVIVFLSIYFVWLSSSALPSKKIAPWPLASTITRTYEWSYDSCNFTVKLTFNKKDYRHYRNKSKHVSTEQSYVRFATEDSSNPYYEMVLRQLDSIARIHQFTKSEFAGFVIAFVQQAIFYKKDPFNWGNDYPRYGIETLVDHHGDCEDMACLLIGLLRSMNYDVVLIAIPGHMALGVSCADCEGSCFELNGVQYFYLESTGPDNPLGYEASEIAGRRHTLYNVPQTAFYVHSISNFMTQVPGNALQIDSITKRPCGDYPCLNTHPMSTKPASKYNQITHSPGDVPLPKPQPKAFIKLSEMRTNSAE